MSNPAPTLNQINAFNATQGTTIDFNIIGGTELVRSNRIYIYDLSDNSLICTHLYVSTESIHELPENTDSSIVYASGKSSADFVNGAQYYAQIQTYTDTAGTQGGSGLSVAKTFWCLVDPTLTITTIPSTISTTSYNVSATYTDTSASVVSNIIQQYQFNLYSATGSLLQSSGVVVGSGTQQGTSALYDISYNFTGLNVGSSYYVTVEVTTTQGMSVTTQSNTFTVSIDTPTLGEATVVNNACDGYISVTSNLSGEYGGSASGEIASFVTSSINDISSLKVNLEPIQDGTPWMSTQNTEPYTFRAVPTQTEDFGHESNTVVGGTVAWNQLYAISSVDASKVDHEVTLTDHRDGTYTLNGTSDTTFNIVGSRYTHSVRKDDKVLYLVSDQVCLTEAPRWSTTKGNKVLNINDNTSEASPAIFIRAGDTYNNVTICPQVFNLTQMFGSTIADYIYTLETNTAGAGVAWFRKLFPNDYYAYDSGSLVSVSGLTSHDMVGFNQWDEEWEVGNLNSLGQNITATGRIRSKNYIRVIPNTRYYFHCGSYPTVDGQGFADVIGYNKNKVAYNGAQSYIPSGGYTGRNTLYLDIPNGVHYIRFALYSKYGAVYKNDICINLSNASLNGTYKPYTKHSYPLDSTLTLRGVPKLDANNKLYYDGDTYESDGTVTRVRGRKVFTGTEQWRWYENTGFWYLSVPNATTSNAYPIASNGVLVRVYADNQIRVYPSDNPTITSETNMNTVFPNGSSVEYRLATPTTETADPYTDPQVVDPSGTEEYVGSPIPVGHKTTYQRICPITGWTGCEVNVAGVNLWDEDWEQGRLNISTGENDTDSSRVRSKNLISVKGNKAYYIVGARISWCEYGANGTFLRAGNSGSFVGPNESFTPSADAYYIRFFTTAGYGGTYNNDISINYPSTDTTYHAHNPNGTTYPVSWQTEAGTVYGGTVDLVTGVLTVDRAMVDLGTLSWTYYAYASKSGGYSDGLQSVIYKPPATDVPNMASNCLEPMSDIRFDNVNYNSGSAVAVNIYGRLKASIPNVTDSASLQSAMNGVQLVYELSTPPTYQLTPTQVACLLGQNNVWADCGDVEVEYNIPITNLLVKRQDVDDISGNWLTLYSKPITQASDMDFIFIDFLNQYGKTYKYALVPLLTQTQSGVEVEVEGGYTVSDEVQSIFDGVFITDSTGSQKCKANVGYGNVDMNQTVGTITPIGAKYPIVITNSQNQYHNGSVSGTIVPDDYYFNGNLSRIDMVNKRDELEQFLTNKRAKIIKDWNGNIWLVMIMDNVSCTFDNNYGMGIVNFSTSWVEVGDPTNQQDLQATGLINIGGV